MIAASAAFGFSAFKNSLTPYVSFKDAQASSGSVQVSGDVLRSRVQYDVKNGTLTFPLKDHTGQVMTVIWNGGKPNNFDQAEKVVAIGKAEGDTFRAERLLTKCPSKYEAAKEGPAPGGYEGPDKRLEQMKQASPKQVGQRFEPVGPAGRTGGDG